MSGGDEEFDRFVQAEAPRLHRLAYLLCGDWHLADDLVQSEQQTALVLGCSIGTVKSQNLRALRALRTLVQRQEITP